MPNHRSMWVTSLWAVLFLLSLRLKMLRTNFAHAKRFTNSFIQGNALRSLKLLRLSIAFFDFWHKASNHPTLEAEEPPNTLNWRVHRSTVFNMILCCHNIYFAWRASHSSIPHRFLLFHFTVILSTYEQFNSQAVNDTLSISQTFWFSVATQAGKLDTLHLCIRSIVDSLRFWTTECSFFSIRHSSICCVMWTQTWFWLVSVCACLVYQ